MRFRIPLHTEIVERSCFALAQIFSTTAILKSMATEGAVSVWLETLLELFPIFIFHGKCLTSDFPISWHSKPRHSLSCMAVECERHSLWTGCLKDYRGTGCFFCEILHLVNLKLSHTSRKWCYATAVLKINLVIIFTNLYMIYERTIYRTVCFLYKTHGFQDYKRYR